jgi:hypothetical protein
MNRSRLAVILGLLVSVTTAQAEQADGDAVALAYLRLPFGADLKPAELEYGGLLDIQGDVVNLVEGKDRPAWLDLRFGAQGVDTLRINGRDVNDLTMTLGLDRETGASDYAAIAGVVAVAAVTGTLVAVAINDDDDDDREVPPPPPGTNP